MPDPTERLARPIDLPADPAQVLRAWPAERALAVLWSAAAGDRRWSRWSVFGEPVGSLRTDEADGHRLRTGWSGAEGARPEILDPTDPLAAIAAATGTLSASRGFGSDVPPFLGGWIGSLSYELGRQIEPVAVHTSRRGDPRSNQASGGWSPRVLLHRCPAAYVHDRVRDRWWVVGESEAARRLPSAELLCERSNEQSGFGLDVDPFIRGGREDYVRGVARVVEYIRAGDVFQANLAHALTGRCRGSARAMFAAMVDAAAPWYGAYIEDLDSEHPGSAVLSASPELFLEFDPATRVVTTRPIKGTRRGDRAGAGAAALAGSAKDAAELAMIVDLMRNDLGRVCEFGSIRVTDARALERHATAVSGGVVHGVATVQGRLRAGLSVADLLRATFPGGSVTGAPKIRAMQIIDELEGRERGAYTGSIGYISDCGRACFNIAIRTAQVIGPWSEEDDRGSWVYHTGAGIVADSDPASEWDETLAKAEVMLRLAREHPLRAGAVAESGAPS